MEEYIKILAATAGKPRPMTQEEYRDLEKGNYSTSGESSWGESSPSPEPEVEPMAVPVEEEAPKKPKEDKVIVSPKGWPKKVKLQDGSVREIRSPKEWRDLVKDRSKDQKYSEQEVRKMIKDDPMHVVTNLMLQRKPEHKDLMFDMLKSLVDWVTDNNLDIQAENNKIISDEMNYMLEKLEGDASMREAEMGVEKTKEQVDELEKMVEEKEKRHAPPAGQSGGSEWNQ